MSTVSNKNDVTFMNDELFKLAFGSCSLNNLLIDRVRCDKSIYNHWTVLTNTMAAILRLQITLRILHQTNPYHKPQQFQLLQ